MGGLALVDPEDGRRLIVAASPGARLDGVRRGMTAVTATALAPELTVRAIDRAELSAVNRDLEVAVRRVSPQIESTGSGVVYASFSGLSRRYEDEGEGGFLDDLRDAAVGLDLPARVGMASCRFVARCAAILETPQGPPMVVSSGQEADFLAPLPLRLLPDALDEVAVLERLGLRSLGELAQLPASGLVRRFGERGGCLHRLARGQDRSKLIPSPEPQRFYQRVHTDFPLGDLEPLLFLMRRPLSLLLGELDAQALAAGTLRWELQLEDHPPLEGCVRAARSSSSMRLWSELLKLDLERNALPSSVLAVDLEAIDVVHQRLDQERMLGPRQAPPGALSRTLASLATELGRGGFGRLSPCTSLLPEGREKWIEEGSFAGNSRGNGEGTELWLAPRAGPARERTTVEEAGSAGGTALSVPVAYRPEVPELPIEVHSDRRGIHSFRHRFGRLDVLRTEGPWDISGRWWDMPVRRRYFQVMSRSEVAWIYLDPESRCWFLAGWLD